MARRLQPYRLSPAHRNGLGRRPKGKPLVGSRGSAPGRVQGAEPLASKVAAGTDSLLGATLGRSEARHLDLCNQPRRSAQSAVSAPTAAYSRLRSTVRNQGAGRLDPPKARRADIAAPTARKGLSIRNVGVRFVSYRNSNTFDERDRYRRKTRPDGAFPLRCSRLSRLSTDAVAPPEGVRTRATAESRLTAVLRPAVLLATLLLGREPGQQQLPGLCQAQADAPRRCPSGSALSIGSGSHIFSWMATSGCSTT